ncbi:unnamed protein product, partial [Nesidiocoris tenuis]
MASQQTLVLSGRSGTFYSSIATNCRFQNYRNCYSFPFMGVTSFYRGMTQKGGDTLFFASNIEAYAFKIMRTEELIRDYILSAFVLADSENLDPNNQGWLK